MEFFGCKVGEWMRYLLHYANGSLLIGDVSMNNSSLLNAVLRSLILLKFEGKYTQAKLLQKYGRVTPYSSSLHSATKIEGTPSMR